MKKILSAALATLLLFAPIGGYAADIKPVIVSSGKLRPVTTGETVPLANGGTGATTQSGAANAVLPTQTGHSGEFLTTNGTAASWAAGGGGGSSITSKDEGSTLTTATTSLDCVGAGIVCTNSTGAVTLTVTGGGAALTLITETVTSGTAASVSFSSIPATYRDLIVVVRGRGTTAATTTQLKMQFNGDTAANYDYQYVAGIGAGASAVSAVAQTSFPLGDLVAASATAGHASGASTEIYDYRGTTFQKVAMSSTAAKWSNTVNNSESILIGGFWRSTAAINAVLIFPTAGAFVDGTVVSIYGRM